MSESQQQGLCQYRDVFGAPGTGAHRYRVLNIAVVDVVATAVVARLITAKHWPLFTVLLIALSVPIHKAFCVKSTLTKLLYPNV